MPKSKTEVTAIYMKCILIIYALMYIDLEFNWLKLCLMKLIIREFCQVIFTEFAEGVMSAITKLAMFLKANNMCYQKLISTRVYIIPEKMNI